MTPTFAALKHGLAGPGWADAREALWACGGVYGTAPTCYLSLAARVPTFTLADLDKEMYGSRRAVRLRCMRSSSYLQPVDLVPALLGATAQVVARPINALVAKSGIDERTYLELCERVDDLLADGLTLTVPQLRQGLGERAPSGERLGFVVTRMCAEARLVKATVTGGWRSDAYAYARWSDWIGAPAEPLAPGDARRELARHYLHAFGPATPADLRWWTGWSGRDTAAALEALGEEVVPVDAWSVVLAAQYERLRTSEPAHGVRLLPVWDAYLMGYRDRSRLVDEAHLERVYDASGNATSVVLIDGRVAGVWEWEPGARLRVAGFDMRVERRWPEIEAEALRLGRLAGEGDLGIERCPPPGRLADGKRNAFLAPIRLGG